MGILWGLLLPARGFNDFVLTQNLGSRQCYVSLLSSSHMPLKCRHLVFPDILQGGMFWFFFFLGWNVCKLFLHVLHVLRCVLDVGMCWCTFVFHVCEFIEDEKGKGNWTLTLAWPSLFQTSLFGDIYPVMRASVKQAQEPACLPGSSFLLTLLFTSWNAGKIPLLPHVPAMASLLCGQTFLLPTFLQYFQSYIPGCIEEEGISHPLSLVCRQSEFS